MSCHSNPGRTPEDEGGGLALVILALILVGLWKLIGAVMEGADKSK